MNVEYNATWNVFWDSVWTWNIIWDFVCCVYEMLIGMLDVFLGLCSIGYAGYTNIWKSFGQAQ